MDRKEIDRAYQNSREKVNKNYFPPRGHPPAHRRSLHLMDLVYGHAKKKKKFSLPHARLYNGTTNFEEHVAGYKNCMVTCKILHESKPSVPYHRQSAAAQVEVGIGQAAFQGHIAQPL